MQKLISVIVPVYNTAPYLNHCIDSILLQTYPNIEIIIVNDGSNDSSGKIIENIVNEHQNIKYIELPMNQGLSAARNIGLEVATGDYIGFVDSDDWIEDSMYEVLYNGIQTYQTKLSSIFPYSVINNQKHINSYPKVKEEVYFDNIETMLYDYIERHDVMVTNKLYERTLFENIKFPIGKVYEDTHISYRLMEASGTCVAIPKFLYARVVRHGSITHSEFSMKSFDYIEHVVGRYEYINSKYSNTELEHLCRKLIFETLMDLTYSLMPTTLSQESVALKKFNEIYNQIFRTYSFYDCEMTSKQLKLVSVLQKNIQSFLILYSANNSKRIT